MRTLSIGETERLLRGTRTVSTGVADESIFIPDMLDESVDMVDVDVDIALSPCWLCVGVGAAAPVPYWFVESVVAVVVVLVVGAGVGSAAGVGWAAGAGSAAGAGIDSAAGAGACIGSAAGAGVVVTSPLVADVDVVLCEPSLETRICVLDWPNTTAGERAIAAIAISLIFMSSPWSAILWTRPTVFGLSGGYRSKVWTAA